MKINKKLRSIVRARNLGSNLFGLIMVLAFIGACITKERVLAVIGIQSFALFMAHTGYFRTRFYDDAVERDSLVKIDPKIKEEALNPSFTYSEILFILGIIVCLVCFISVSNLAFGFGPILSTTASFIIGVMAMLTGYVARWGFNING